MNIEDLDHDRGVDRLKNVLVQQFNVAIVSMALKSDVLLSQDFWGASVFDPGEGLVLGVDLKKTDPRASLLPTRVTLDSGVQLPVLYQDQHMPFAGPAIIVF